MTTRIELYAGVALFRAADIPVFIGTTAKESPYSPFPWSEKVGSSIAGFEFRPAEDDSGTLVFDHSDPKQRTSTSQIFYQFWWEKDKLIVREGLTRVATHFTLSDDDGLSHYDDTREKYRVYCTHKGKRFGANDRIVNVIDLLRFIERKIDLAELDRRVIK